MDFYTSLPGNTAINFYGDWDSGWPSVYAHRDKTTCLDKVYGCLWCINHLQVNQSSASLSMSRMPITVWVHGGRDRWWFLAFSNCNGGELSIWQFRCILY